MGVGKGKVRTKYNQNEYKMETNQKVKDLYEYVQHSLIFVEAKHGVITALNGGAIIGIGSMLQDYAINNYFHQNNCWYYLAFVPPIFSLVFSLSSFYPPRAIQKKSQELCNGTLFNCENLSAFSEEELVQMLADGNELSRFDREKVAYIQRTAKVVGRKYKLFRKALLCLSLYGLLLLAYLIVQFIGLIFKI
jgi:hypothetical protein